MSNSITLHHVIKADPNKVYRAFTEANALASWLPPYGFYATVHQFEPKVGGSYKMSFTNFSTGSSHSFGGEFLELKPGERIRHTDRFEGMNLPDDMITTITLKKVSCGTDFTVKQENIPAMIPAEMCYLGWQESLDKLIKLVEPNIPDAG